METIYAEILKAMKSELVMALGCTDPGVTAYGAASAVNLLEGRISRIKVQVSSGIYKNGAATFVPGTGKRGLLVAAALGCAIADPQKGLMIFDDVSEEQLDRMNELLVRKIVTVEPVEKKRSNVYVEAFAEDCQGNTARAVISGSYNNLVYLEKNSTAIMGTYPQNATEDHGKDDGHPFFKGIEMKDILSFVENIPLEELIFIRESIKTNWKIAEYGIDHENGLKIGRTIKRTVDEGKCACDMISEACMMTAAAVDVRMSGYNLPAMSCVGSGNQGILASVPIITVAKRLSIGEEKLLRALALSYTVTIYTKEYLGKISVLCGCGTTAGVGCAAGMTFLMGGKREQIKGSIHNLIAGLSGMVCDGAKEGCALKIMNAVYGIMQSSLLSIQGVAATQENGIIGSNEKETIMNLEKLSQFGMADTDKIIINIIKEKLVRD